MFRKDQTTESLSDIRILPTHNKVSICSNVSNKADDDNMSIGGMSCRRWRNETIVSVVVPEKSANDDENRKKKRIFTPSIVEYVKVLSLIYALITTIIGLIFTISEALTHRWLNATYSAVFLSYQLIGATAFLIYLQILLIYDRKRSRKKDRRSAEATLPPPPPPHQSVIGSKTAAVFAEEEVNAASNNNNNPFDPTDAVSGEHRRTSNFAIRFRSHMMDTANDDVSLASGMSTPIGGTSMFARRQHQLTATDFDQQISDDDVSASPSVAWMDVSKFGSIFNHEGSSLFLKVGALIFSLGNIIYYSLEIENSLTQNEFCRNKARYGWTFFPRLIFVLVQTFFIFKGNDVKVRKQLPIIWFGMLHVVSTNICLWFRTVVREIMEEFQYKDEHLTSDENETTVVSFNSSSHPNKTGTGDDACENALLHAASRYLFPFILEYSLIAVGTVACISQSIAQPTDHEGHLVKGLKNLIKVCSFQKTDTNDDGKSSAGSASNGHGRPILNKSHAGLFLGALLFAAVVVAIVLFYFHGSKQSTVIYLMADLVVHSCLLVGCVVALVLLRPLAYVAKPLSIDDALLIMAMCGSFLYEVAIITASSSAIDGGHSSDVEEPLRLSASIVAGVQTVAQSMLILCAIRRYPSTEAHVVQMPGRGTIAFLIVGNVSVWVLRTVLAKAADLKTPSEFYGEVPWLLIMNLNLPLLLFFRFHCSVCFADVWHVAYTPLLIKLRKMQQSNAAAAAATAPIDQPSVQVPRICVISPSRSQSYANLENDQPDVVSVASGRSTTM